MQKKLKDELGWCRSLQFLLSVVLGAQVNTLDHRLCRLS